MKEKRKKHDKHKKSKKEKKKEKCRRDDSTSSSSSSDEWVEKVTTKSNQADRDDWMSMTGMIKTYSREDVKPQHSEKEKKHIDSYNPATCSRELNPYWKDGGTGLPQTPESFRTSRPFIKPSNSDDYYSKSYRKKDYKTEEDDHKDFKKHQKSHDSTEYKRSYNWKKSNDSKDGSKKHNDLNDIKPLTQPESSKTVKSPDSAYLNDEKMNKLAAKIVKAEIMGDTKVLNELKAKLEAAREYRKQNPDAGESTEEHVILTSTSTSGNSRPLTKPQSGDSRSRDGKRKCETHQSGERAKYFGNDDKYSLAQMFEEEKYGNNYDNEAQLAKVASKHKNPNDDLEDIFTDEISKNDNTEKLEKERAIREHVKMEKSIEGCEYCVDSKNMLKHLMVSCGNKVYLALPSRKSLVKSQCLITTIQHSNCVTSLDEDVWEEIMNYRKALTKFFNAQNQDVVFYETATRLHRYPHFVIHCVPMPRDVGDMAAIYFKKALLECEAEWSMNKKVIDLKGKNIRKGVPKGLPYFWIDFGMDPGFAHIIEDQQLFPKTFAEEVIGGILDLNHTLWKTPQKEYGDHQRKKVLEFVTEWKPFDTVAKK